MKFLLPWHNKSRTAKHRPRISRWGQAKAEPVKHIPLTQSGPFETTTMDYAQSLPVPVDSLPLYPGIVPDPVTSIVLTGTSDAPSRATSVVSGNEVRSSASNGQSREPREPSMDTLPERLRRVLAPPLDCLLPGPDSVLEWPGELMPFQLDGVKLLLDSERLLLADDMGLGKTLQVIVALRVLFIHRDIGSALVVAPASILDQWRQELQKWAPDLRAMVIRGNPADRAWQWAAQVHVAIVGYETLRSDYTDSPYSPLGKKTWDVLVADEAQRIKNPNPTSRTVKSLKRMRSWALTGTPLENNEEELASIVEFVDHHEGLPPNIYSPGLNLRERHRELQLRRKKAEVLQDLPPKLTTKLKIPLLPKQQRSYERAERDGIVHLRELGTDVRVQHVLELIARLKQICNSEPESGESSKFENIRNRIETLANQGNRALVFSQYTSAGFGVAAMSEVLREFDPLTFTGDHTMEERRDIIRRFRTDDRHKALIVSLRAGGVGLNLQEASYVFHLDRWWNPAVERQAEDRSHRYGQDVPVQVFKYSCIGTIEERIDLILEQKQELFDELVDDVSIDLAKTLSVGQLFGLFGLDIPAGRGRK